MAAVTTRAPAETMPSSRMAMMIAVAAIFDAVQILFSLSFILFPLVLGIAVASTVGGAITDTCSKIIGVGDFCSYVGSAVGSYAGVQTAAAGVVAGIAAGGAAATIGSAFASIIGVISFLVFFLWFTFSGVTFFGSARAQKRYTMRIMQTILDSLPFVSLLPWITIGVWVTCREARAEDRENAQKAAEAAKKEAATTQARQQAIAMATQTKEAQASAELQAEEAQARAIRQQEKKIREAMDMPQEPLEEEGQYADVG